MKVPAGDREAAALAERCVEGPRLVDPDFAEQRFGDWLTSLVPSVAEEIDKLLRQSPWTRAILFGIAEAAPYLFDLIKADSARTLRLLHSVPETCLDELIERVDELAELDSEAELMSGLRKAKAEAALLVALCDIGGVWTVPQVTTALSDFAVAAVRSATKFLLRQEMGRGRIKPNDAAKPEDGSGLIVLAMGKMGAGELNYSSDIDLIVFFDPTAPVLSPNVEPHPFFVRLAQGMARLLQQRTSDGYVFRVDLRLRPDPASTAVAISIEAALSYYEREGRTWERAAMIKAKPCAGDPKAGDKLLAEIAPFVWRRHLDFSALADVHEMKRQMQVFRGQNEIMVEGHNVKVGRGGIREIEFFAQTQQLIVGGRHKELRLRPTLAVLDALAAGNWIAGETRAELAAAYHFLRRVEHRLQMINDEQTHALPDDTGELERFARFFGYGSRDVFAEILISHLRVVQGHYAGLFEGAMDQAAKTPPVDFGIGPDDARLIEYFSGLGFKKPIMIAATVQSWLKGEYRVFRREVTRRSFAVILPALISGLARAEDPDAAVTAFDRLLQALQRGGRLISLLGQNSELVALVALIVGVAPRLGDMLARQPQLMDGLVDPRFFGAMPDRRELSSRLAATVSDANSYEEFLDRLRLFGQESLLLIGTRILSGTVTAQQAGVAFADVAEGIVDTVHRLVSDQFIAQHGRVKGQETAILAMGRLGSREMTAASDLDLILLYDFDSEHPDSDGPRSLHGAQYFARFTQRLISAFTTRTNYGVLYDIDMRLRPSGRAGPVASRIDAFSEYQERDAWSWEHMALTRARVISASPAFRDRIEAIIRNVLTRHRSDMAVAHDVVTMRQAIAQEKGESELWDLKHAAGGITDIDFIAQYLQLVYAETHPEILNPNTLQVLHTATRLDILSSPLSQTLRAAGRLYHDLTQILRLCVSDKFVPETAGEGLLRALARAGDAPDFSTLEARVRETQSEVRRIFRELLEA